MSHSDTDPSPERWCRHGAPTMFDPCPLCERGDPQPIEIDEDNPAPSAEGEPA